MKKFKKAFAVLMGVVCMGSMVTAVGCDSGNTPEQHEHKYSAEWTYDETDHWHKATCEHTDEVSGKAEHSLTDNKCTVCDYEKAAEVISQFDVTFDLNYTGATNAAPTKVNSGEKVTKPADPTQAGFTFLGWYTEAENGVLFDFEAAITANVTAYAHWAAEGATLFTVSFDHNYEGAPAATTVAVEDGKKVTAPNVTRTEKLTSPDGKTSYDFASYTLEGWYTSAACTTKYNFNTAVTEDVTVYAKWSTKKTYEFEAELVDLSGKTGYGYSISYNDEQLIRFDSKEMNQGAHLGLSVGYLYAEDLFIEFVINSDKAVNNVELSARLSAEFRDVFIANEQTTKDGTVYQEFWFQVNGARVEYEPITLTGAKPTGMINQRPYSNHVISKNVSLKQGENKIRLFVANSEFFESTVSAMAPMIDCISLSCNATLTWQPKWENLEKVRTDLV